MRCEKIDGFGENLRAMIRERGMTIYQVGDLIDRDYTDVSKWCRGASTPNTATVKKLAAALSCTTDYLFFGKSEKDNWIKSAYPPDGNQRVFCTVMTESRHRIVTTACYDNGKWSCEPLFTVLAWQPMPAVYKGW